MEQYRDVWERYANAGVPLVMYGMGDGADKITAEIEKDGGTVADWFASDGFVRGQNFHGKRVCTLGQIKEKYKDFLVVLAFGSSREDVMELFCAVDRDCDLTVPDVPVCGTERFDYPFYMRHREELLMARDMLWDARSREVFDTILEAKLHGRLRDILACADCRWFDAQSPVSHLTPSVFADCGAYRGDTVKAAITAFPGLRKIYALEPEPKTFKKLKSYCDTVTGCTVLPVMAAAWNRNAPIPFGGGDNRGASAGGDSGQTVAGMTVDALCRDDMPDLIKFDVEGAEEQALEGCAETLNRCRPALIVSLYHRSEDMYRLPLWLKNHTEDYRFYLRRGKSVPAWDIELYAIPREKDRP